MSWKGFAGGAGSSMTDPMLAPFPGGSSKISLKATGSAKKKTSVEAGREDEIGGSVKASAETIGLRSSALGIGTAWRRKRRSMRAGIFGRESACCVTGWTSVGLHVAKATSSVQPMSQLSRA
jgi:hypothetical protein